MKKIDYSTRSFFNEFVSEDTNFIKKIIKKYEIHSALEIPCANGRNLSVIGSNVVNAFFADINPKMVEIVQRKILDENWYNCSAMILDLCDLTNFMYHVDAVFIMQQAFQMLSVQQGKIALQNLKSINCKYIIIDVYDFKCKTLDTPRFLVTSNSFFDLDAREWTRNSSISSIKNNWVRLIHTYKSNKEICYAEVKLFNYSRSQIISLCKEAGYQILDYFTDYSFGKNNSLGRTIVIIQKE